MEWYRKVLNESEGVPFSSLEGEVIKEMVPTNLCDGEVVFIMESGNEYCLTQIHDCWPDAREVVIEPAHSDLSGGVITLAEELVKSVSEDKWLGDKAFSYHIKTTRGDLVVKWFNEFDDSRSYPEHAILFKMPKQVDSEKWCEYTITAKEAIELCKSNVGGNWFSEEDAVIWEKYNLTVIGDAHLPSGKRLHIVKEDAKYLPRELDNALVFSLEDA